MMTAPAPAPAPPRPRLTPHRLDLYARRALEYAYAGAPAPLFDNPALAPGLYATVIAGAYIGLTAAIATGDDPQECARVGAVGALTGWLDAHWDGVSGAPVC